MARRVTLSGAAFASELGRSHQLAVTVVGPPGAILLASRELTGAHQGAVLAIPLPLPVLLSVPHRADRLHRAGGVEIEPSAVGDIGDLIQAQTDQFADEPHRQRLSTGNLSAPLVRT